MGTGSPKALGKAVYPGFMVPDMSMLSTKVSFKPAKKFIKPNMPRDLDISAKRRMNPVEYRGSNMSDCMYHTMTSFKQGREYVSPKNKTSPDWKIPRGGVNCV